MEEFIIFFLFFFIGVQNIVRNDDSSQREFRVPGKGQLALAAGMSLSLVKWHMDLRTNSSDTVQMRET